MGLTMERALTYKWSLDKEFMVLWNIENINSLIKNTNMIFA